MFTTAAPHPPATNRQARHESEGAGGLRDRSGRVRAASPEALRLQHRRAAGPGKTIKCCFFEYSFMLSLLSWCSQLRDKTIQYSSLPSPLRLLAFRLFHDAADLVEEGDAGDVGGMGVVVGRINRARFASVCTRRTHVLLLCPRKMDEQK